MNNIQYTFEANKLNIQTHVGNFAFNWITQFTFDNPDKLKSFIKNNPNLFGTEGVYCFVVDNTIRYIGKIEGRTVNQNLKKRLNGYLKPGKSQHTNKRIRTLLKDANIDLYFLEKHNDLNLTLKDIENILIGYCWSKNLLNIGV